MTQLRGSHCPECNYDLDPISNWFDSVLAGIGHRGSSFTDIDRLVVRALTHDGLSRRFLFQEFKRPREECSNGQWWALSDLARQPRTTVWLVRQCEGLESVELTVFFSEPNAGLLKAETLSIEAYRQRFADWWNQAQTKPADGIADRVVWSEYVKRDPSLQAFLAAELEQERLASHVARLERDQWKRTAEALSSKVGARTRTQVVGVDLYAFDLPEE